MIALGCCHVKSREFVQWCPAYGSIQRRTTPWYARPPFAANLQTKLRPNIGFAAGLTILTMTYYDDDDYYYYYNNYLPLLLHTITITIK